MTTTNEPSENPATKELGYQLFDSDNHYYEPEDAFLRHSDPQLQHKAPRWIQVVDGGGKRLVFGDRMNRFLGSDHTFDPIGQTRRPLDPRRAEGLDLDELEGLARRFGSGAHNGDAASAASAASALMLAIFAKERLGIGQYVRTTMLIGNAYSYSDEFNAYAGKPASRLTDPDQLGLSPVYRLYPAASGWVFLAVPNDEDWRGFCQVVDSDLADDPRFLSAEGRDDHATELSGRLETLFAGRSAEAWEENLAPKGIGCVAVYEGGASSFACTDPALRSTGHVVEVDHPIFGRFLRHGLPQRFSETPGHLGTGCWAGQHTHTILKELGYTSERIARLEADGIIAVRRNQQKP